MKFKPLRLLATLAMLLVAAACSLPRGAPIKSEVTGENSLPEGVVIEEVTRTSVQAMSNWPASGWHGHYHWFARVPGPASKLIKPGDMIVLTVWDNQENSLLLGPTERSTPLRPVEVTTTGAVFIPYIGEVNVGGLTPEQARQSIQEKLIPIASTAQVQIEVQPGVRNSVDVVSGVAQPGVVQLANRNVSVLSVLARTGGISTNMRNPVVRLMRDGKSYAVPAKTLFEDPAKNVTVRGGDQIVVVEEDRYFVAVGSTENEELVYFHQDRISAVEAVSLLGGLQDARANPEGLLILRQYPKSAVRQDGKGPKAEYVVFVVDLTDADSLFGARNFDIQPRDIVVATESAVKPAQAVIALAGSLFAISNVFN